MELESKKASLNDASIESQIQKFYKNTNVFVTGGTGLLGKILIEKLLRSTSVSTIYMLVREQNGKNVQNRIDELFEDIVFQRLKYELPMYRHKIVVMSGDCAVPGLGLSTNDRMVLVKNVNVVFHVAATLDFDEHLKKAYAINVNGTIECLELGKQIEHLKSFVHVSSAYANCVLDEIDEIFYECPVHYKEVSQLIDKKGDNEIEKLTPKILRKWPNTYVFTKALAEDFIQENGNGIPIGVFRPSIVTSTYKEPIEGWMNNLSGPTGITAGVLSGVIHTLYCDENVTANIVPVDTCVAALIASAWDISNKNFERSSTSIPIYNYVSSVENPITWEEFITLGRIYGTRYPLLQSIWIATFTTTKSKLVNKMCQWAFHYVPAVGLDLLSMVILQKPKMVQLYQKIHNFSGVLGYFATKEWTYTNRNVVDLWEKMNEADKELFPFSMKEVLWTNYFRTYVRGIKEYLLKEPMSTLEKAKQKQTRLEIAHSLVKYSLFYASAYFMCSQIYKTIILTFGAEENS